MDDNYCIVEPLGNKSNYTKLERYWKGFEGKYGLRTKRVTQFDPYASMSRRPIKYILEKFEIPRTIPDEEWIKKALENFIRDEIVLIDNDIPQEFIPVVDEEIEMQDDFLYDFLRNSEWENFLKIELPKDDTNEEMANCIYELLCNPQIGSIKNAENNNKDKFVENIMPFIEEQKRLLFVLPGFPFKDQNRFRVPYKASEIDFGEISFLIRLHNLIQTLYQVHPYGAEALILSDGRLYQDIFNISVLEVDEYQWRLNYYRNRLNIQGDVSVIDLKELIDRADENNEITEIVSYIEKIISEKYVKTDSFQRLVQGMKWNINSKVVLEKLSDEDAWKILKNSKEEIDSSLVNIWDEYNEIAIKAAIKYSAINLMLRWTDLLKKFFPESIRCTVHPKKGQFALAMNYAWNGVAWSKKWPRNIKDITTVPYYYLEKFGKIKLVKFRGNNYPCFFTKEQYNQNLEFAKNVLKKDGWNVDNIFGREFTVYDLNQFAALGKDDENFAWERRKMSEEYYTALLQFRISHYKKYNFGVHAIFMDGKLIGQMGLQVLDEKKNQLEYVIFLGKKYTRQGIGTKLLKFLFDRCKEEGINTIYGVIRSDNEVSRKVMTKFNGKEIKTMAHYQQTGVLYKIKL